VPFRRPRAEAGGEALQEIGRKRDLRHEHQDLPARLERRRHRLEIDLGLAGAGHAVKQGDREGVGCNRLAEDAGCRRLLIGQFRGGKVRIGGRRCRLRRHHHGL
jgi:hypothetical protein